MSDNVAERAMGGGLQREEARLAALERYDILDTAPEEAFDRITRLTRRVFDVPMSTLTLIDGHRQWFKSRQGLDASETPKTHALCNVVIRADEPLVIPDTLADARFADNPFVTGHPHLRFYVGVPIRSAEGHGIGTLCAMDTRPHEVAPDAVAALGDLARIVESELELRTLALTDMLTGALSRRALRSEGGRALTLALRHRQPLSCIMFDLDHFKQINDTHGHAVGDAVLVAAAAACRGTIRKSDLFGRVGGEEFAVLLPQTDLAHAGRVAEKVRAAIAACAVGDAAEPVHVTASFGVSAAAADMADIEALLQRADAALYAAKAQGRNCCVTLKPAEAPRHEMRRRVLKAGRISFNAGHSSIDCTVRTLSPVGAGLDVTSTADIPQQFKLQIESDNLYRLCGIVSKSPRHLEVAFEAAA